MNSTTEVPDDEIQFPTLPFHNNYYYLMFDIQEWRGGDIRQQNPIYYRPYYRIKKNQNEWLEMLFNGISLKEELRPILKMCYVSMCYSVSRVPNFADSKEYFKNEFENLFLLIPFLKELKENKKKLHSIYFEYHDSNSENTKKSIRHINIKGNTASEFLQSILSLYEQAFDLSDLNKMYKYAFDARVLSPESSPADVNDMFSLMNRRKHYFYYLMYFLIKFQVRNVDVNDSSVIHGQLPPLTPSESKRYSYNRLILFCGRLLELAGLITYKQRKGQNRLPGDMYERSQLLETVKTMWRDRKSYQLFQEGIIKPKI